MPRVYLLLAIIFFFFSSSCIQHIEPEIRVEKPTLVVEGLITTDAPPYTVSLSYSGPFTRSNSVPPENKINDAIVTISDDAGNITPCIPTGDGKYQTLDSSFIGTPGRGYELHVKLSDGREYRSTPQTMPEPVPIDSITVTVDNSFSDRRPTQFVIAVNAKDAAGTRNYYRWKGFGYAPRKATGVPCGFFCLIGEYCYQLFSTTEINLLSDRFIDGRNIVNQTVHRSPIFWFGKHFIDISQYSITRDAYQFWEKYKEQTTRTGSILDPLPAPLQGNIANVEDPGDLSLGFFEASSVSHKKVIIIPFYLQEYLLKSIAGGFIGVGDCSVIYPNAFYNDNDPTGWETAQEIEIH